jgi:transcription elongation factor Elf1
MRIQNLHLSNEREGKMRRRRRRRRRKKKKKKKKEKFGCIHRGIHRSALSMCRSQQEIGQLIFLLSCNMKRSVADRRRSPGM